MECAKCGETTVDRPCRNCGGDPLLSGRFRLLEPLGRGTSGTTWRARREDTGALVALKEMNLHRANDRKTRELWRREVRVLEQLHHPQIPRFVESFEVGTGRSRRLCLVQELVPGRTLADEMQRRRYAEADVLEVAHGLLSVLAYLHGLQPPVVHRDIKPENVLRRDDGVLVLLDFGSVRDAVPDADLGGSTVAGTFGYMAPEQFRGEAGPASDYYALGGLMVTLLTRKAPRTLLDARGSMQWREHCRVSDTTGGLVDALLAHDPADRPADAAAFEALLHGPVHREVDAIEALFAPQPAPGLPARPVPAALAGVPLLASGVALGLGVFTIGLVGSAFTRLPRAQPEVTLARLELPEPTPAWTPPVLEPLVPPRLPHAPPPAVGFVWNRTGDGLAVTGEAGRVWMPPGTLVALPLPAPEVQVRVGAHAVSLPVDGLVVCEPEGCAPGTWPELDVPPLDTPAGWPHGLDERTAVVCTTLASFGRDGELLHASAEDCPAPFARVAESTLAERVGASGPGRATLPVRFEPEGPRREVVIASGTDEPVYVDGRHVGSTPWLGTLTVGVHRLQAGGRPDLVDVRPGVGAQLVRP